MEESLEAAENILGLANPLMVMLGRIKDEDVEIFNKLISKRTFDSGYEYFDKSMEEMAYQADLVIKKIVSFRNSHLFCYELRVFLYHYLYIKISKQLPGRMI